MKKIIAVMLIFACTAFAEDRKMSMNDGIKFRGNYMPVAAVRNYTALEMILGCMDSGADRSYCQCSVDNTFKNFDAEQFLMFVKDISQFQDVINKAKDYCDKDPAKKIPPTAREGGMIGGEISTYLIKEIMLDCIEDGHGEEACLCSANGIERLDGNKMQYLKVIDARKENIFNHLTKDKIFKNIVNDCGI